MILTREEHDQCNAWARERYLTQRSNGVRDLKAGRDGNLITDYIGVASEYVVVKFLGITDWTPVLPRGDGGGIDFRLADGRSVSVKATRQSWGRMIVPGHQEVVADLIIFATINMHELEVKIVGYLTHEDYLLHRYWASDLPRPAWVVDQDKFTKLTPKTLPA